MTYYNDEKRELFRNKVINGARSYQKLTKKRFLILTDDNKYTEIEFHVEDFKHLTGLKSNLNDEQFFKNGIKGNIRKENINASQKYNFNTLKHKTNQIEKIDKLIYADISESLFLINIKTDTADFNYGIKNNNKNICVAFVGEDNHARSLRKKNTLSEDEIMIIAIFEKPIIDGKPIELYEHLVYLKNIQKLKLNTYNFKENLSKQLLNRLSIS